MTEYILRVSTAATAFELRVNDFPLFLYTDENNIGFEIPVSLYLKEGENEIGITLRKNPLDTKVRFKAELFSRNGDARASLATFESPEFSEENMSPVFETKLVFTTVSKIKDPVYFKGVDLTKVPNISIILMNVFKEIHSLFAAKNSKEILELSEEKIREMSERSEEPMGTLTERIRSSMLKEMNNSMWNLKPLTIKEVKPEYYCNGRLATLIEISSGDPVIKYTTSDESMEVAYPFYLYSPDGKNLIVIR